MARTTGPVITPALLTTAEQEARTLLQQVYTPQPVKQPDGAVLLLCGMSRLDRAMARAAAERAGGNGARADQLDAAIATLQAQYLAACDKAEAAAAQWAAMAAAAGVSVDPNAVYPEPCTCVGCAENRLRHDLATAQAKVHLTIAQLVTHDDAGAVPPVVSLMAQAATDAKARDQLWWHLKRIADALQGYAEAAKAAGETNVFGYQQVLKGVLG